MIFVIKINNMKVTEQIVNSIIIFVANFKVLKIESMLVRKITK